LRERDTGGQGQPGFGVFLDGKVKWKIKRSDVRLRDHEGIAVERRESQGAVISGCEARGNQTGFRLRFAFVCERAADSVPGLVVNEAPFAVGITVGRNFDGPALGDDPAGAFPTFWNTGDRT
jgi:hypothetical protein